MTVTVDSPVSRKLLTTLSISRLRFTKSAPFDSATWDRNCDTGFHSPVGEARRIEAHLSLRAQHYRRRSHVSTVGNGCDEPRSKITVTTRAGELKFPFGKSLKHNHSITTDDTRDELYDVLQVIRDIVRLEVMSTMAPSKMTPFSVSIRVDVSRTQIT